MIQAQEKINSLTAQDLLSMSDDEVKQLLDKKRKQIQQGHR